MSRKCLDASLRLLGGLRTRPRAGHGERHMVTKAARKDAARGQRPRLSRREHSQHLSDISVLILFLEENMALLHRCFVHAPEHSHRVMRENAGLCSGEVHEPRVKADHVN